jgi:PKD domain
VEHFRYPAIAGLVMARPGRRRLAPTLLSTGLIIFALPKVAVSAAPPEPCPNPLDLSGCQDLEHGSVTVGVAVIREGGGPRSGSAKPASTPTDEQLDFAASAQFCRDLTANAAAAGSAPAPLVPLCGLAALPAGVPVAPSREQVLTAFKRLPLYRGAIQTSPPEFTLVNLDTYFWCADAARSCADIGEGQRQVTLLGQAVRVRPKILTYTWDFGDGSGQTTTGRATHTYRHSGIVTVTVIITWTADYALPGEDFQSLDDTTTTTSPSRQLPVQEAQAVIVGP